MRAFTFFICVLYYLVVPKFLCYVWDAFIVKQYFLPSISYKTMFALYISYLAVTKLIPIEEARIEELRDVCNKTETEIEDLRRQEHDTCLEVLYTKLMHFTQLAIAYVILIIIQ